MFKPTSVAIVTGSWDPKKFENNLSTEFRHRVGFWIADGNCSA